MVCGVWRRTRPGAVACGWPGDESGAPQKKKNQDEVNCGWGWGWNLDRWATPRRERSGETGERMAKMKKKGPAYQSQITVGYPQSAQGVAEAGRNA